MSFARKLLYSVAALSTGLYFLILGLVEAKVFLAPLVTAIILALLMIPVSNKVESWGGGQRNFITYKYNHNLVNFAWHCFFSIFSGKKLY